MSVPEAAIEAAAERLYMRIEAVYKFDRTEWTQSPDKDEWRNDARAAIEAAMPAIREAIAQELESAYPRGTVSTAARIVRGGVR